MAKQEKKQMFEVFGEFDSSEELNEAAAGQKEQGDFESLRALAKENGIDDEDVEDYINGDIPELATVLSAALGKLKVEKKLENNVLVDDVTDYISANCDDVPMALAVRKKGKRTMKAAELVATEAKKNKITIPGMGTCNYCGPMKGFQIIKDYYLKG